MKRILIIIGSLAIIIISVWLILGKRKTYDEVPKQQTLQVGKHSTEFNGSINALITEYLALKDAFVNADTQKIKEYQKKLIATVDSIKLNELTNDTSGIYQSAQSLLGDVRSNAVAIAKETDITEMRQNFRMVSENLFPFLKAIGYEGQKLYWQNCPMAFADDKEGSWLSNTEEIINPYLGKNHPKYKGTMLHCGLVKDSIQ